MKQTVLIGLGGTGSRVVNNVAKILRQKDIDINDGIVTCAVLDTNQSDNDLIKASGTDIPVIPTCDERTIDRYLQDYASKNPLTWCPYSRAFGAESMIDGASEMRAKSRLAFMDTMASEGIYDLQNAIEKVFHNRPGTPEKIRVMLVSSLSGGTGAGMFLQVALWLRQFFDSRNCQATIRGIFLLPDVFIRTVPNIRNNPRKKLYHYANAYAAIRELNAMNKVIKEKVQLERPIVIPDLFDSRKPPKKPIFDNAFFIDDVDAKGAAFDSIEAYEEMVAQIVYMQLYAPMHNEMVSVEDNLFRAFEKSSEPVFGSCGTAKAVYPVEDVLEYCALRAAADSISQGWSRLDAEINDMIADEKAAEKDGAVITNPINIRDAYVKLFDEKSQKTGKEVGISDKLFVAIKNDIFNETRGSTGKGDETAVTLDCKVEEFIKLVEEEIQRSITENGGCEKVIKIGNSLPDPETPDNFPEGLEKTLQEVRGQEKNTVARVLREFDENYKGYADAIIRAIVPLDMGSINKNDEKSLFGLFQKRDANNQLRFVHPIAARYLLYKLAREIEERQSRLIPDKRRKKAENGDTEKVSFDNPNTRKKETLDEYWKQVGFVTSKKELQHFLRKYKLFNAENKNLCMQYETEALTQLVLNTLKERVDALIKHMENLFGDFNDLSEQLKQDVEKNVERNANDLEKTLYIYAKREHKEDQYQSLGIDLTGQINDLYGDAIESVYGKFCAEYRPSAEDNLTYAEKRIITSFYKAIVDNYAKLLKKEYKKELELDVISAICKESDYAYAEHKRKNGNDDDENIFTAETESAKAKNRHMDAILSYRNRLAHMAVPFLQAQTEASLIDISEIDGLVKDENNALWMVTGSGNKLQIPIQTELTFWGFHPNIGKIFPQIGAMLGANKATSADKGYGVNELYCYSSIYGVKAEAISKFNEMTGGAYYENYSAVINTMIRDKSEIDTPHIDKTWHEFLPYVSASMQANYNQTFYKTLWFAVAYGRITLDAAGKYQISEKNRDSYGNEVYEFKPLLENGRSIAAADVHRLITALRGYPDFEMSIARDLEAKFENDLEGMTTYVGTKIIKGLLVEGDLNPITMIVRYATAKDANTGIKADMLGGLRVILKELASNYDTNRSDDMIYEASVRLLHRLYEKSGMVTKRQTLKELVKEFKNLKLAVEGDDSEDGAGTAEVVDII